MDMHEILKMALKELEANASPDDVAAYIKACVDKQAAIEGAAAAEEKKAEKEAEALADPAAELPPEVKIEEQPPAAMSAAPAAEMAAPAAMAETTPEAAGTSQLDTVLADMGTTLAALLARIAEDPTGFKAWLGATAGTTDAAPASTNVPLTAEYEGTAEYKAMAAERDALKDQVATLTAKVTEFAASAASAKVTDEEAQAKALKAAEDAKRKALSDRVRNVISLGKLVPARGRTTDEVVATWTELGMTNPDAFTAGMETFEANTGVPTQRINATGDARTLSASAPGQDGDDAHLGPEFELARVQYLAAGYSDKDAKTAARATALKVTGNGTPTTKITGAA